MRSEVDLNEIKGGSKWNKEMMQMKTCVDPQMRSGYSNHIIKCKWNQENQMNSGHSNEIRCLSKWNQGFI